MQTGVRRGTFVPLGIVAGLVVLAADQASKWWVLNVLDLPELRQVVLLPVLNLTMVWNRGVSFGLFQADSLAGRLFLLGFSGLVVVARQRVRRFYRINQKEQRRHPTSEHLSRR